MRFKRTDSAPSCAARRRGRRRASGGRLPAGVSARALRPVALAFLLAASVAPHPVRAQVPGSGGRGVESGTWFPARTSFAPLLASPREVGLRGSLVLADRPDLDEDFEGRNLEAEVALGHRFGVLRLQRADRRRPELTLGFEVGAFSRFHLETPERDLIGVDYRVGLPLSLRHRGWEGRLTPLHVSSHIGDDFLARFEARSSQFTRDGVELAVARRLRVPRGLRIYASGTWNYHVNPGVPETEGAFGIEWDPAPSRSAGARAAPRSDRSDGLDAWPFAAVDLRFTDRTRGPGATGAAGAALRVGDTLLRLELRGHTGPSALGQLRGTDETFVGLGLRVEP